MEDNSLDILMKIEDSFFENVFKEHENKKNIERMGRDEKIAEIEQISNLVSQHKEISPECFEVLVFLCNDQELNDYCLENLNKLMKTFATAYHADHQNNWLARFIRMFAFLKGKTIFNYFDPEEMDYWGLRVVYILRTLRLIGIADFQKVWKKAIDNNKLVLESVEFYCRVRGLRRVSRMLWKNLDPYSPFRYYEWKGEFLDLNYLNPKHFYYPPDKPCELLRIMTILPWFG